MTDDDRVKVSWDETQPDGKVIARSKTLYSPEDAETFQRLVIAAGNCYPSAWALEEHGLRQYARGTTPDMLFLLRDILESSTSDRSKLETIEILMKAC